MVTELKFDKLFKIEKKTVRFFEFPTFKISDGWQGKNERKESKSGIGPLLGRPMLKILTATLKF